MSYQGVMRLAREHPFRPSGDFDVDWLMVVRGCYEETKGHEGKIFDGSSVVDRLRLLPGFENVYEGLFSACLFQPLDKYRYFFVDANNYRGQSTVSCLNYCLRGPSSLSPSGYSWLHFGYT